MSKILSDATAHRRSPGRRGAGVSPTLRLLAGAVLGLATDACFFALPRPFPGFWSGAHLRFRRGIPGFGWIAQYSRPPVPRLLGSRELLGFTALNRPVVRRDSPGLLVPASCRT